MKPFLFYSIFLFFLYGCKTQYKNQYPTIGIGILEANTTYPIPLFKNKKDTKPIDTIKFKTRDDGSTEFITKINLKPYTIYEGDTFEEGRRQINMGLISIGAKLRFRVIDSTQTYYKVITNEDTQESYFIKIDSDRAYYKTLDELYESKGTNPKSIYNPNWNIFETWERYLKRVEFITKRGLKIYDKPNGKVIFEDTNNDFLPFNVTELKGEWIKLRKGFGREFKFDKSKNYEGWTQWRNGNEILIDITEETYE